MNQIIFSQFPRIGLTIAFGLFTLTGCDQNQISETPNLGTPQETQIVTENEPKPPEQKPPTQEQEVNKILFTNVNVFDGKSEQLITGQNVLVENNLIKKIAPDIQAEGATVIDGGGRTLMPGLIDAHVHLSITEPINVLRDQQDWMFWGATSAAEAEKMLLRGWTTVRDAGGPAIGLARAIDQGKIPGPRVYPSGPVISQTSGHGEHRHYTTQHPNMPGNPVPFFNQYLEFLADGVPEVLRATREVLRMGATQVKLMAGGGVSSSTDPLHTVQYLPDELEAAVKAAEDWDTYVLVHVYEDAGILRSIEAGVQSLDHATLMTEKSAQAIKKADVWVVPYFSMLGLDSDQIATALGSHAVEKFLKVQAGAKNQMQLLKKFNIRKVGFSTDIIGNPVALEKQNNEFGYRLEGWNSYEILLQATSLNAELLTLSGQLNPYTEGTLGVIEEGAYADVLLVEGNPVENVKLLENYKDNIKVIVKDGKFFKNTLDEKQTTTASPVSLLINN